DCHSPKGLRIDDKLTTASLRGQSPKQSIILNLAFRIFKILKIFHYFIFLRFKIIDCHDSIA
ncbi:hypothetical protein, partial [Helicobacter sp.]|uniref:hypothetical protein n=1 Tax=Helicobacter sp. TaxID=218 RepID=UPI0025C0E07B